MLSQSHRTQQPFVHVHVYVSTLTFRLSATGRYSDSIIDVLIS